MFLVDSHCHFDLLDKASENRDANHVIMKAKESGVHYFLNVSVSITAFPGLLATANEYPCMSVSVGLHPNAQDEEVNTENLLALAQHPKVIAIGETGLDYYRSTGELGWQQERFKRHIEVAKQLQKPLIIHTRNAKEDTLKIMQETGAEKVGGVMHCFSEDWATAQHAMALGFYISFSGIVTFKNATTIQEVARQVPLDRILIETDSPYLAPDPKRGKPNEPSYVRYTAEYLAKLRNLSLEEFAEQTTQNFFSLFKGAVRPHV